MAEHGTRARYQRDKCRCASCREAQNMYGRDHWRKTHIPTGNNRRIEREPPPPRAVEVEVDPPNTFEAWAEKRRAEW